MIQRTAHAKINLALHVTAQRDDGYHLLDSLVTFTRYGDLIKVEKPHHPHGPITVSVDGHFSDGLTAGPENLVTAAALILREAVINAGGKPAPVEIALTKNLPIASGIGGGSANAAATLLALQEYWQSEVPLEEIALGLGADVPMCLESKPLRARGIGEEISVLKCENAFHMVLVNPGVSVATPEVFKRLSQKENAPIELSAPEHFPSLDVIASTMRNDLENPAKEFSPEIHTVLEALRVEGARLARMSGSGATCFGIFEGQEEANSACHAIRKAHSNWWCIATQTCVT